MRSCTSVPGRSTGSNSLASPSGSGAAAPGRNVTFPARQYSVNGERRSFALLRPVVDTTAQHKLRDLILEAYQEHEAQVAVTE